MQWNRFVQGIFAVTLVATSVLSGRTACATSAAQYRSQGLSYRSQGQLKEAIVALQKAADLEPKNLAGQVALGWTLHLSGQEQRAAAVLLQNFKHNPYYVPTLNALGIVYLVKGDLLAAVLTHGWAAILAPNNEIPYYNLSLSFERLHCYDWAIVTATRAAALEPENPHPLVALSIAHWGKAEKQVAQQIYQQAITVDGRYQSSDFLAYLNEAGFSVDQIERSRQVLQSL